MRLTDEERRIADRVAERMAEENDADDAWEHAMLYIASRRKAFGEVETPGTATDDRDLPTWDADGEEIPPESVAAVAVAVGTDGLFSGRIRMAEAAVRWCHDLKASVVPVNIVTALDALGLLRPTDPEPAAGEDCPASGGCPPPDSAAGQDTPGTATAAGVGSHEVEVRVGQGDDGTGVPLTARIVRPATAAGVGVVASDGDEIRLGDIVLATTWDNYYQRKEFVVGYISEYNAEFFETYTLTRYTVKRDDGRVFLADRLEKITPEERRRLSSDRKAGETPWDHLARIRGETQIDAAKGGGA